MLGGPQGGEVSGQPGQGGSSALPLLPSSGALRPVGRLRGHLSPGPVDSVSGEGGRSRPPS